MALIPRSGSLTQSSHQTDQQVAADITDVLSQAPSIKDTLTNRTAFNPDTFRDEFKSLIGLQEGIRIKVTYFLRSTAQADRRSDAMDVSSARNIIHTRYTCINNMEITLTDGMTYGYDAEKNEATVTGEAFIYFGITPNIGDIFLFDLTDGSRGIFVVSSSEPMTVRPLREHKITFALHEFASDERVQNLLDMSKITYFDKTTYLSSTSTLLNHQSYTNLITLRKLRKVLAKYYYRVFFNRSESIILRPDGVYDPYLVRYILNKISFTEVHARSIQYPVEDEIYDATLWARLSDAQNCSVADLYAGYRIDIQRKSYRDVYITPVVNRPVLSICEGTTVQPDGIMNEASLTDTSSWMCQPMLIPNEEPFYIFSRYFYAGALTKMTIFERVVYDAIARKEIEDVTGIIDLYLNKYLLLSKRDQFYHIPIYLALIDMSIETTMMASKGDGAE